MVKYRIEIAIFGMIAVLGLFDAILIAQGSMQVDWAGYIPSVSFAALLSLLGLYYRHYRDDHRLGSTLLAAGAFIAFTLAASIFNYLLLPIRFAPIDEHLLSVDTAFGYSWANMVAWAAQYPRLSLALNYVYFSSLPQLILALLVLGFSGRIGRLWAFLTVGLVSVILCMAIWFFFPSFGPTTLLSLTPEIIEAASLGVTPSYGAELLRLAEFGEDYLSPSKILGLIAFPSFHTVMALMVVVYLWEIAYLRWAVLAVNLLMVLAILIHGGHYAVDLVGGLVVFLLVHWYVNHFYHDNSVI